MANPTVVLVDTTALIDQCLADISPIIGTKPKKLALDLEGVELGRHGRVSIVQIFADTSDTIWLVDVTTLGTVAFDHKDSYGQSLREVLQGPDTRKLLFDVRMDADALWNIYQIDLANVYDLQLLDVASRRSRFVPANFLNGLRRCIEFYVRPSNEWKEVKQAGIDLFLPEKGGSYMIFEKRPLDARIIAYCAQDVALIFQLEVAMKKTIRGNRETSWDERIMICSAKRVAESKSYNFGLSNKAMAPIF